MKRTARTVLAFLLICIVALAGAATITAEGTVLEVNDSGWLLKVGSETIPVVDSPTTRYWRKHAPGERDDFKVGDAVGIRIRNDVSPALMREVADAATWKWLHKVRTEIMACTLVRVDSEGVTVLFGDGKTFTYRPTVKTRCSLQGQPVNVVELDPGKRLYVRGRLQSNLETWLVAISDNPKLPTKADEKPKPLQLPPFGILRGSMERHLPNHRIFDIRYEDRILHITYGPRTVFVLEGKKTLPTQMRNGQEVRIAYKRDGFGRLVATKVELFQAG
ncbi:MAG: hypothetical protein ACO1SV_22275 [Fimbriimonas sp.]